VGKHIDGEHRHLLQAPPLQAMPSQTLALTMGDPVAVGGEGEEENEDGEQEPLPPSARLGCEHIGGCRPGECAMLFAPLVPLQGIPSPPRHLYHTMRTEPTALSQRLWRHAMPSSSGSKQRPDARMMCP